MREINKNCRGCGFLMYNKLECLLTKSGIVEIPNCPCQECLIMIVCGNVCEKFYENAGLNNAAFSNEFISKLTVGTLSRIRSRKWGPI